MSQKQAKKLRKEIRKHVSQETAAHLPPIPLAGCPMCNHKSWYVRLDQPPPKHEWIVSIICANPGCNQEIGIGLNIEEHAKKTNQAQEDVSIGQHCDKCGFELYDCQCE